MKTIEIHSYQELHDFVSSIESELSLIWRGHANSIWKIDSSLKRHFDRYQIQGKQQRESLEKKAIDYYVRQTQTAKKSKDFFTAMVELQHYGCPSRLIDFTSSEYVALYFCLRDRYENRALYAFDRKYLMLNITGSFDNVHDEDDDSPDEPFVYMPEKYYRIINRETDQYSPLPIRFIDQKNRRLTAQKSFFVYESDIVNGSNSYLEQIPDTNAFKILFHNSLDDEINKKLLEMHIDGMHLFEGIIGIAESSRTMLTINE